MFDVQWVKLRLAELTKRTRDNWSVRITHLGTWLILCGPDVQGPTYESATDMCQALDNLVNGRGT